MAVRRILGPVAATVVVAATGVLGLPGPADGAPATAAAAACGGADGVTAIVDFNELGGGVTAACDPGGAGKAASQLFPDVGYPLTYAQEGSGFVCRVSGKPADDPCVRTPPATAYWSLWWSDGTSGKWVYSTDGVGSLTVPDGGYVAFSWHQGSGNAAAPDVAPTPHEEPSSTPSATGSTGGPAGGGGGGGGHHSSSPTAPGSTGTTSTAPTESPSASPTDAEHRRKHHRDRQDETGGKRKHPHADEPSPSDATSSALPEATDLTAGPPADATRDDTGSSFPLWLGIGIAVVVLGAAGAVPLLRRRTG